MVCGNTDWGVEGQQREMLQQWSRNEMVKLSSAGVLMLEGVAGMESKGKSRQTSWRKTGQSSAQSR